MTLAPRENPLLFGHGEAEATFAAALQSGRMHHAWLLSGPPGVGKATLAYRLARRVLSVGGDPNDPANPVFRRVARETHADVLTLEREFDPRTKKLKQEVAVAQVRDVAGFMHLTPAEGGWRIVVVDGAEDMNRNAANALLKVLEEPPRRALLLLTADAPGRLLPTIRSRCRRLRLGALNHAEMAAALRALLPAVDDDARGELAAAARGSPGQAVALAEDGALALAALVREVLGTTVMVPRMHAVADAVTRVGAGGETGFATFMGLLQSGLADRVRDAARGRAMLGVRPLAEWGEMWHALVRLQDETERFNLDKRTAVIAGLELLNTT